MFSFIPAALNLEIERRCSAMGPTANSPWVSGEIELNAETVDNETLSCWSTSPAVPESSHCGTDVIYALFSVGVIQEPTGAESNDDAQRQHLETEAKMDAARIRGANDGENAISC